MSGTEEDLDADARVVEGESPPSRRVALSRERIIDAAVILIDRDGLAALSMRRLGERLGVEAMSLYRYVPGREDLLDAVVERIVGEMDHDEEVIAAPRDGWQDFLQRIAHGVRRVALAHPMVFPLVASRPLDAPWLRPPLRSLAWVERFLAGLTDEGFTDEDAAAAYRGFSSFLLGHLLLEVSTHGADVGPLDVIEDADRTGDLTEFPTVRRLQDELSSDQAVVEFEESLENLLHRIDLAHHSAARTPQIKRLPQA